MLGLVLRPELARVRAGATVRVRVSVRVRDWVSVRFRAWPTAEPKAEAKAEAKVAQFELNSEDLGTKPNPSPSYDSYPPQGGEEVQTIEERLIGYKFRKQAMSDFHEEVTRTTPINPRHL